MKNLPGKIAKSIIQDVITANDLQPGDRLPTVRDIQALFEVSTSTITKAFELLADQGLVDIRHGSGCFLKKHPPIKRQQTEKSRFAAVLPHYAKYSMISTIEQQLTDECRMHGCEIQIQGITSYQQERDSVQEALSAGVDGLVVYPMPRTIKQSRTDYLYALEPTPPVVLIDLGNPKHRLPQIRFDNYQAGYEITRKLLAEGRTRIAFKRLKNRNKEILYRSNDDRYQGYQQALYEIGQPGLPELCWQEEFSTRSTSPSRGTAEEFVMRWKSLPPSRRADAVICLEDIHAATLIHEALKEGIAIPDELKIVGFDNNPHAEKMAGQPFPTTLPDFAYMARLAVSTLLRTLRQPAECVETYILPVPLKWM